MCPGLEDKILDYYLYLLSAEEPKDEEVAKYNKV